MKSQYKELSIRQLIEAAYLHGFQVHNLDTGEMESPKTLEETMWIADSIKTLIQRERIKAQIEILNKAHRVKGENDADNATDEYIDELTEELESLLEKQ